VRVAAGDAVAGHCDHPSHDQAGRSG
jgi:hypothetical protein